MNHIFLQKENEFHVKSKWKMFKKNSGTKIREYNTNIHKAVIIPDGIFKIIMIYLW